MPQDEIHLDPTTEDDLDLVLRMERSPENRAFIRQWTRNQHLAAMADEFKRIVIGRKGEGFGRAAVRRVKNMVFDEYKVHRLWLEVMEHN